MAVEKEFNYAETGQRRLILASLLCVVFTLSFCISDLSLVLGHYFQYSGVIRIVLWFLLGGVLAGNLAGRGIFSSVGPSHIPHAVAGFFFILAAGAYLARYQLFPGRGEPVMILYSSGDFLIPLFAGFVGFCAGFLFDYYLKVSCGDYLDEHHGIRSFLFLFCTGIFAGLLLPGLRFFSGFPGPWKSIVFFIVPVVAMLPGLFFIRLKYNPASFIAKNFMEEAVSEEEKEAHREELYFTYLNMAYIVIYVYLAGQMYLRYFGTSVPLKLIFVALAFGGFLPGMLAGRLFRNAVWPVYTQMLFPLSFFLFVFLLLSAPARTPFYIAVLLSLIPFMVFGFALYRTLSMIADNFTQVRRFQILNLSLFVLPVPLVIALSLVSFTNFLYFVFLYFVAIMNILVPVIFLFNKKINPVKKFIFFLISLMFVPAVIFIHLSLNIPVNGDFFVQRVAGYDAVQTTNYSLNFIKSRAVVTLDREPVFRLDDTRIRNLKRAVIPVAMYHFRQGPDEKILIIDGNQRFFRNPVFGLFPSLTVVDSLSDRDVDNNRLPISGSQGYIVEEMEMLRFLKHDAKSYRTVVDMPNVRDQICYYYHFTDEYFQTIKSRLAPDGQFVQVVSLKDIRPEFLFSSAQSLKKAFRHSITYLFYDVMVVISSDADDAFVMTPERYEYLKKIFDDDPRVKGLFYSDLHFLSHLLFVEIDDLLSFLDKEKPSLLYMLSKRRQFMPEAEFFENFTGGNGKILPFVSRTGNGIYVYNNIQSRLVYDQQILSVLKKTEVAEADERYEEETGYLFSLRSQASYKPDLSSYLQAMLIYKEEYYGIAAHTYEREKRWEEAAKLYRAILTINPGNFDANYRMGFLCIVLQDLDNAFRYLSNAMTLKPGDPKVLYQMGVLLFSKGDYTGSINYLNQSVQQKEDSASVYLYLGLAHEEQGRLVEAEAFYRSALLRDPNDPTIKSRLDGLVEKRTGVPASGEGTPMKNQMEDEQGEALPLPVNKSAYDVRIGDKQAEAEGGTLFVPVPMPEPNGEVRTEPTPAQ